MKPWYGERARNTPRAQGLCSNRAAAYYRYDVIVQMRAAGHTLAEIGGYFLISSERVRQIIKRGLIPVQLELPTTTEDVT